MSPQLHQDCQPVRENKTNLGIGAGNIGQDTTVYTDGGVVREGIQGESVEGDYSTGRGGAGNIPKVEAQSETRRRSTDFVPEINQRVPQEDYHTGVCLMEWI